MRDTLPLLHADWQAPAHVHAVVTTRAGGVSAAPWDSLNLGTHVEDNPVHVAQNRAHLQQALCRVAPCTDPQWLNQVHGIRVLEASADTVLHSSASLPAADAVTTTVAGLPCIVMTADCLPVFFCDRAGTRVAVAHAGWRGLCDGVLEATVQAFADPAQVMAWMGPAIGPSAFEVGSEVREAFVARHAEAIAAFVPSSGTGRWFADIYALARLRLASAGVTSVSGGGRCTVMERETFFSYRRDGRTGRMASVIWRSGA